MSFPIAVERRTDMGWTAKLYLRLEDGQPLVAQLPNEEIQSVGPGQRLYANLRNPKVFSDDREKTVSDARGEPAPEDERDQDAHELAEGSELTSARPA
jgi:hypothetical protein